jgi:hypothetical protein
MRHVALALALAAVSCAHGVARLVHRDQTGGVVELGSGRDEGDYAAARRLMMEQCGPAGAEVISEGEETIGARVRTVGTPYVRTSRVREETVWRIHYRCGGAADQ